MALKYNLSYYNDVYILLMGKITIIRHQETQVIFKFFSPFVKCITKTDETIIDDAKNLDLVMLIYNLVEYSSNYSETTESWWFDSKDGAPNFDADVTDDNNFKSFKHKAKLLENTIRKYKWNFKKRNNYCANKILSNIWKLLEMPLIDCKIELKLKWTKYCVLPPAVADTVNGNNNDNDIIFTIKDTKLYVLVATLSAKNNQKLLKLFSKGFEISVYWNEYKRKGQNKYTTNKFRFFSNKILLELINSLF